MDIKQIVGTIIRDKPALQFPLANHGGWIADANSHHVLDVRGWGYLQYHSDGQEAAATLQDAIADWVVKTLNEEAVRQGLITQ